MRQNLKSKSQACYHGRNCHSGHLLLELKRIIFDVFSVFHSVWLGSGSKNTSLDYNKPLHVVIHMFEVSRPPMCVFFWPFHRVAKL